MTQRSMRSQVSNKSLIKIADATARNDAETNPFSVEISHRSSHIASCWYFKVIFCVGDLLGVIFLSVIWDVCLFSAFMCLERSG